MALTNLPYDDEAIIAAAESATVLGRRCATCRSTSRAPASPTTASRA
ncbi:hypothetical protein BC477_10825 [Clavibacter michiganensis subsp. michiganensis]|uniref:Uncharacterized protein n=1 Tax=Clavibacter michiganensis subsp. michiganensis TaxID=33013 RepID=A0A251XP97_CLAMM|nr:hypothetical protein BC477_10825 [Clavibacter michiganensis subsp. michiganensis]OUE05220.1 hypothetical protein CMMCAS07_09745 [Clavibacter michiganensis subsp. michiganensis]